MVSAHCICGILDTIKQRGHSHLSGWLCVGWHHQCKASQPERSSGSFSHDDDIPDRLLTSLYRQSVILTIEPTLRPPLAKDDASDTRSHSSRSSFKIGTIPPSPRPASSSGFNDPLAMGPAHSNDTQTQARRRTCSNVLVPDAGLDPTFQTV